MAAAPQSLKELFLDALAQPAEGRAEWLSQACPDDGLRRQVELMLAAHEAPQSVLDQVAPPADPHATELYTATSVVPGVTIGPYKLLQPLGEGGMGVVYMAEQTKPVERRVALKIIKPGMDTRQVIARFEAERQALALMDHPNIAKVLDAGTTGTGTKSAAPTFVHSAVANHQARQAQAAPANSASDLGTFAMGVASEPEFGQRTCPTAGPIS